MKNRLLMVLLIVAPFNVLAGTIEHAEITIDIANGSVQGSMLGARNSADPSSFISCQVTGSGTFSSPGSLGTFCYANTTAQGFSFCWSGSPQVAEAASSVSASSYINFNWDPNGSNGGECTSVNVNNGSWLLE